MSVTVAELQKNLNNYIALAEKEDISISDGTRIVAVLSSPNQYNNRIETAKSLFGILPSDANLENSKEERLSKIWKFFLILA